MLNWKTIAILNNTYLRLMIENGRDTQPRFTAFRFILTTVL